MHILFLSDNFPPEVNAPASRTFEHCREWVRLGHQVTVDHLCPQFTQVQGLCRLQKQSLAVGGDGRDPRPPGSIDIRPTASFSKGLSII